jgi:hypothetical protein
LCSGTIAHCVVACTASSRVQLFCFATNVSQQKTSAANRNFLCVPHSCQVGTVYAALFCLYNIDVHTAPLSMCGLASCAYSQWDIHSVLRSQHCRKFDLKPQGMTYDQWGQARQLAGPQAVPNWNSPVRGKQLFCDRYCMRIATRYRFLDPQSAKLIKIQGHQNNLYSVRSCNAPTRRARTQCVYRNSSN